MQEGNDKKKPDLFPVAARDLESLQIYFTVKNVKQVGHRSTQNVVEIRDPDNPDSRNKKQVWVRPSDENGKYYTGYKSAWEAVHGSLPDPNVFHIDHVQSKARGGEKGYKYVRLFKVKSHVNKAWGYTLEKLFTRTPTNPMGPYPICMIDIYQRCKIDGIMPLDSPYAILAEHAAKKSFEIAKNKKNKQW